MAPLPPDDEELCATNPSSLPSRLTEQYQDPAEQIATFFDDSFNCPVPGCHMVYSKRDNYRKHRVSRHGLPRFTCIVCSAPFNTYNDLVDHMTNENHMMACTCCNLKFFRPGEAHSHYNQKHKSFTCAYCALKVTGKLGLQNHLQVHFDEVIPFNAASYVEVAIDSSFSETFHDSPYAVHILQDGDVTGSGCSPTKPDYGNASTTADPVFEAPAGSGGLLPIADSSNVNCSDTDTADVESDSDLTPTNTFGNGVSSSSSVLNVEAVVFGPGASELFSGQSTNQLTETADVPQPSPSTDMDNVTGWIGHNVDMYQSMSEKHKKTYRFNCTKCSCSFSKKDILKRHLNIHEIVCKYCFLKFDSLAEHKIHVHEQHSKPQNFHCSICSHSLQGLKSLMVHEMVHRLNLAFKREAEDAGLLDLLHRERSEYFQCSICTKVVRSFSNFVRHKVWHNWESMWNTYATGRIFKGTFTEDEAKKFRKEVEKKLEKKWRDCGGSKVVSTSTLDTAEAIDQTGDLERLCTNNEADGLEVPVATTWTDVIDKTVEGFQNSTPEETDSSNIQDDSISSKENCNEESDTESSDGESETGEGTSISVSDWMGYWSSYLGIDESPPSWVKPIMKDIRKKWKSYNNLEMTSLYKQMDQISMLIRAQKKEASTLDGPTVLLEKLPASNVQPKMNPESRNINLVPETLNKVTNVTAKVVRKNMPSIRPTNKIQNNTSSCIKEHHVPASSKRVQRTAQNNTPTCIKERPGPASSKTVHKTAQNNTPSCIKERPGPASSKRVHKTAQNNTPSCSKERPGPASAKRVHKTAQNNTTTCRLKMSPGPASAKRVHQTAPTSPECLEKTKTGLCEKRSERAINSFLKCLVSERVQVRECSVSLQRSPGNQATSVESLKSTSVPDEKLADPKTVLLSISKDECLFGKKRPRVVLKRISENESTSLKSSQPDTCEKTGAQQAKRLSDSTLALKRPRIILSRISGNEGTAPGSSNSALQSDSQKSDDQQIGAVAGVRLPEEGCKFDLRKPLVILSRVDDIEALAKENISKQTMPCNTLLPPAPDFHQIEERIRREIGFQMIPLWATPLIKSICNSPIPPAQKMGKVSQVIHLIKLERGNNRNSVQMPVVQITHCV